MALICDVDGTLYHQQTVRRQMVIRLAAFCLTSPLLGMKTVHTLRVYRQAQEYLRQQQTTDASAQADWTAAQIGYSAAWVNHCVREWMETRPWPVVARTLL